MKNFIKHIIVNAAQSEDVFNNDLPDLLRSTLIFNVIRIKEMRNKSMAELKPAGSLQ